MQALLVDSRSGKPVMKTGEYPAPKAGPSELLVKIEATALNRADLLQKSGRYPPPEGASPILGLEMAGIVEKAGAHVQGFKKGDRVFGLLPGGGYAEYCTIHHKLAMKIPHDLSFEEAAAIPEVFLTAFQALVWLGELAGKETVLIHAGASGVGTAAIQLAKQLRHARVAATAGSAEKLSACKNLGADLAINYKKENFADAITREFGKNSTDLIIDFIGSPYWDQNIDILAMDGRLVYLSLLGGATVDRISLVPVLRKRLTIRGSTLRNRNEDYKIRLTRDFASQTQGLFEDRTLHPVIDSVYMWKNVEKAHQRMAANQNTGKIVLTGM